MGKRSNGEGTVRKNEDRDRWEGRLVVGYGADGRPIRKMVTGPTKKAVLDRMNTLRNASEAGQELARADLTIRRFLEAWLDDVLPGTVAATTEQQYRDVVRLYIVPTIGMKRLRTLTARDVAAMLRTLAAEGRAPNTQRLARSVLRRALRWAEAEGMVARNVAALANGVKVGRSDGRTLTVDQARQLLDAVKGDRLGPAVTVALSLGLRRGELLGLAWEDVDLDATPPRLTVSRGLVRIKGKGLVLDDTKTAGSRRTVHLPAPVVDALRRHRIRQLEERLVVGADWPERPLGYDLVFRTPFGTALDPDNFRQFVYRVTAEAFTPGDERPTRKGERWPTAYRWSPHELRHSAASLLIAQGVPMKLVSEVLGHSSIRITADVYGHLFDEAGAVAADAMTAALWGGAEG